MGFMIFLSFLTALVHAQDNGMYTDLRFAAMLERASLPVGSAVRPHIGPQRAVLGSEWFYGDHRVKVGANLFEQFHPQAPEVISAPQLWDAQWRYRFSEQLTLNAGRQALPIGRSDQPIQSASVQPHSLSQLMGQSQFRADGFGFGFRSKLNVDSAVSSIGTDMDGQARLLASTRLSHETERHHHSLSVVYKSHSQDPYAVLVLDHFWKSTSVGVSAITGANSSKPFWGAEARLAWTRSLAQGAFESLRIYERTAYLSPSGALRDLESRLQSDTSFELVHQGPTRYGLGYSLFYPINATIPIEHRASFQLHIDY